MHFGMDRKDYWLAVVGLHVAYQLTWTYPVSLLDTCTVT